MIKVPQIPWGYRSMWVVAMFDLPVLEPNQRKAYARFRKDLLDDGFSMMQYSVYKRHCASIENAEVHISRMGKLLPAEGEVRFFIITDVQYSRTRIFVGKKRKAQEKTPSQLEFF
jgi:CRISPR-associated protein Cas2